jgi:hypothetical protein
MQSLNSIEFDTSGFDFGGEHDGALIWYTPAGDGIGLWYFSIAPDLAVDLNAIDRVRDYHRASAINNGMAIVEVDVLQLAGCQSLRQIIKVPQQPKGMLYMGSITFPFRDFSYVLKVQCMETGTTGVRDSTVLAQKMSAGEVSFDEETKKLRGWMYDPYDPTISYPLLPSGGMCCYNSSDAVEYDRVFPTHPLSRLRKILAGIQSTLVVDRSVSNAPKFEYRGYRSN